MMHKMLTIILLRLLCCSPFKFWSATDHTGHFILGPKGQIKTIMMVTAKTLYISILCATQLLSLQQSCSKFTLCFCLLHF